MSWVVRQKLQPCENELRTWSLAASVLALPCGGCAQLSGLDSFAGYAQGTLITGFDTVEQLEGWTACDDCTVEWESTTYGHLPGALHAGRPEMDGHGFVVLKSFSELEGWLEPDRLDIWLEARGAIDAVRVTFKFPGAQSKQWPIESAMDQQLPGDVSAVRKILNGGYSVPLEASDAEAAGDSGGVGDGSGYLQIWVGPGDKSGPADLFVDDIWLEPKP